MTEIGRKAALLWLAAAVGWSASACPKARAAGLADLFKKKPDTSGGAKDGSYTVLLAVCRSPAGHVNQAKHYKFYTEKHAGWKHLFILHKENHSLLYWGKYKTVEAAQPNLKTAKAYMTPASIRVYNRAIVVPLPGKEIGPPEWKLTATPDKYVFTVLRATFYDVPEADYVGRRQFAVDYCKQLRNKGELAYFHHDPTQSIVTIGLFERSAVAEVRKGKQYQRIVRDPRVKSTFKRYPHLAVNGRQKIVTMIEPKTGKRLKVPASSYLMIIPRKKPAHVPTATTRPADRPGHPEPGEAAGDPPSARPPAGSGTKPRQGPGLFGR
jgi:hypothetical protein